MGVTTLKMERPHLKPARIAENSLPLILHNLFYFSISILPCVLVTELCHFFSAPLSLHGVPFLESSVSISLVLGIAQTF